MTFVVDVAPPVVTITAPSDGTGIAPDAALTVRATITDAGSGVTGAAAQLDGVSPTPVVMTASAPGSYSATVPTAGAPAGSRTLRVGAVDAVGNLSLRTVTVILNGPLVPGYAAPAAS